MTLTLSVIRRRCAFMLCCTVALDVLGAISQPTAVRTVETGTVLGRVANADTGSCFERIFDAYGRENNLQAQGNGTVFHAGLRMRF